MTVPEMLQERTVIATGLVLSILGILTLFILLTFTELPLEELTVIEKARDGEEVRVHARIEQVRHVKNGTITILTIAEEVKRKAIIFDAVNVSEGMRVDLAGEVQMYEGEPELVVRRLETR